MSTKTSTPPVVKQVDARASRKQNRLLIWVFLAPTLIGLGLFSFIPIIGSIVLAFFRWDIITAPQFVGIDNFVELASNPTVRVSFFNTITFVIAAVILQLAIALGLAILVQSKMPERLRTFFRSTLFFPLILSAASVSLIMSYLFNQEFGPDQPVPRPAGDREGRLAHHRLRRQGGRADRLCLAELRLHLPAVHRRCRRHPASGLRSLVHRWRHRLEAVPAHHASPGQPDDVGGLVMAIISALQIFDQPTSSTAVALVTRPGRR